jgi:3-hydroxybutyryl-CoA dehydrogenase
MNVILAGEMPFVEEIGQLSVKAGYRTSIYLVEDFVSAYQSSKIIDDIFDADVIIELQNESSAAKKELLKIFSKQAKQEALILTSAFPTSTTQAASWITKSDRVIGFGLMPPIAQNNLVEMAAAIQSSRDALEEARKFWSTLGMEPIEVSDGPGLVRARIVCCLINEAVSALSEGVATARDIDRAMKLGMNYPYGPFEWADYIGLDAVLGVMSGLFEEWGEDRYRPAPYLKRLVLAGRLGEKSGEGFFIYEGSQ